MIIRIYLNFEQNFASEQHFIFPIQAVSTYMYKRRADYMCDPVLDEAGVSIAIVSTEMQIYTEVLDGQQRRHLADICSNARDGLQDLYSLVHRAIECDRFQVDCRFVPGLRYPLNEIDFFRIRVFRDGELLRQYPYLQRIFTEIRTQLPRLLNFVSVANFGNILQLRRATADYLLQDGLDKDQSPFESLIWIPQRDTASLPSIATRPNACTPVNPDLLSGAHSRPCRTAHVQTERPRHRGVESLTYIVTSLRARLCVPRYHDALAMRQPDSYRASTSGVQQRSKYPRT